MKKILCAVLALCICLVLTGCGGTGGGFGLWSAVLVLAALGALALAILRTISFLRYSRRRNRRKRKPARLDGLTILLYGTAAVLVLLALVAAALPGGDTPDPGETSGSTGEPSGTGTPGTTEPQPTDTTPTVSGESTLVLEPEKSETSDPMRWGINWEIIVNGEEVESYSRQEPISFGDPEDYFALPGVGTFRGDNYRSSPSYGTAQVTAQTLTLDWTYATSTLPGSGWSGSGWTGQPLIVRWDAQTKQNMNLYHSAKAKEDLVEVIYATLDGHIYFLDLQTGEATRDPIYLGMCFKGAGSLDPRGYPLLYVGAGDENSDGDRPRMFIISLIDGAVLYEYGHEETLSVRRDNRDWCAFDSAPLVDAETDTLIWPGESGILYTIKLHSAYDAASGTVAVDPEVEAVTRYQTNRSSEENYWYGYEASVSVSGGYLYVSENGGMFFCVDLNTMELVWAQDTKDDSNASPVFQRVGDDTAYVYTAPSLHWTKDAESAGTISIYKLDAESGDIVWEAPYDVYTVDGVSGGVQSTPLLGQAGTSMEGLLICSISRAPYSWSGILVALDTETGQEVWRHSMDNYAWSSPVAVYGEDGTGYVVICDFGGVAYLLDGATGETLDTLDLGGYVEASPAVFEDMLVVGTRHQQICGIKIS